MERKKGFSAVEFLLILGIMSLLVSIVLFIISPFDYMREVGNATRWTHMNIVANSVYEMEEFPACLDGEPVDLRECEGELVPDFLDSLPEDPKTKGESYEITVDWIGDGEEETAVKCEGECTGYVIGTKRGEMLKIISTAEEAQKESVQVIQ